ncbi:MAG: SEC-C domain-containing protein [Bacillaceae bacterium]|nr:SEC-C domain-containing protein [Bacillaceae bacterium]
MNANRNQPCPCGSGKKFKKCCLNKQNVIQLHEVKEERFYQQKQRMVGNVRDFLDRNQSFGELKRIESEFNHRINRSMSEKTRKPIFLFLASLFLQIREWIARYRMV